MKQQKLKLIFDETETKKSINNEMISYLYANTYNNVILNFFNPELGLQDTECTIRN